jgi:hypothetical protein
LHWGNVVFLTAGFSDVAELLLWHWNFSVSCYTWELSEYKL